MSINFFGYLLLGHWFADFLCQTEYMRNNKAYSLNALHAHIMAYGMILFIFLFPGIYDDPVYIMWLAVNIFAHYVVDFYTSKLSAYFYENDNIKWSMNIVGVDQILHIFIFYYTAVLFF